MTNPYQTPASVLEPKRTRRSLWPRIVGLVSMLLSSLITLYGGFIILVIVLNTGGIAGPLPTWVILILGGLILSLGLGLGAFGLGMWMRRRRLTAYGGAAVCLSISTYVATAMVLI